MSFGKLLGVVTNFPGKNLPHRIKRDNDGGVLAFPLRLSRNRSAQYGHQRPVLIPLPSVRCAANNGGTSAYGMSGIVSVPMPSAAPSGLAGTAVRVSKRASVTLNLIDNATTETSFVIQRATNANFTVGLTNQTVAANTTTVTQTNLYRGVTYFFRIQAVNMGGGSAWSKVFSVITP